MTTPYHAKYFAYELDRAGNSGLDRIRQSLFNASVDLNPHQVEAAVFALNSPLRRGVLLADEVGLGKTIEAGLVMSQLWAERKRHLLVICPASLCRQWQMEMEEKFNLPVCLLESNSFSTARRNMSGLFNGEQIIIGSYHYMSRIADQLKKVPWDLVVMDEAHWMRNSHLGSNVMGRTLRRALAGRRKLLLTATPIQNSLNELYSLASLIDPDIFADFPAFRSLTTELSPENMSQLRHRLRIFCRRTLRKDVSEFVHYTERRLITVKYEPSDEEVKFYSDISEYLQRQDTYAFPKAQRSLMVMVMRKILSSSPKALEFSLVAIRERLARLLEAQPDPVATRKSDREFSRFFISSICMVAETPADFDFGEEESEGESAPIDLVKLKREIRQIDEFILWVRTHAIDTKCWKLLQALETGFKEMRKVGAPLKAVIFTQSVKTLTFLREFLENNGYLNQVVCFSGESDKDPQSRRIYKEYMRERRGKPKADMAGNRSMRIGQAIVEHFRRHANILIASDAGAEGLNLQFCSTVINYDLPWNPQVMEHRIGRLHRMGQKFDVVVINFLNTRNGIDVRLYNLLSGKLKLFDGVLGSSDEVISDLDFTTSLEVNILNIFQQCRTEKQIEEGFEKLQAQMDDKIAFQMAEVKKLIMDHFDEEVRHKLRIDYTDALESLDEFGRKFWLLTKAALQNFAEFDDETLSFTLDKSPYPDCVNGTYYLRPKTDVRDKDNIRIEYQLDAAEVYHYNSELSEWCSQWAKQLELECREVTFNLTGYRHRIPELEPLKGLSGYLMLNQFTVESLDPKQYLLFSGFVSEPYRDLPHETLALLFRLDGEVGGLVFPTENVNVSLEAKMQSLVEERLKQYKQESHQYYQEQCDKLYFWVDDCKEAAEREMKEIQRKIRDARERFKNSKTLDERNALVEELEKLELENRIGRQRIFDVEDEISASRDKLLRKMERKLIKGSSSLPLFIIKWRVI